MGIKFICERCQQRLFLPNNSIGKDVRCPVCDNDCRVPSPMDSGVSESSNPVVSNALLCASAGGSSSGAFHIRWECPWCESECTSPAHEAGKVILCTKCQEPLILPQYGGIAVDKDTKRTIPEIPASESLGDAKTLKLKRVGGSPTSNRFVEKRRIETEARGYGSDDLRQTESRRKVIVRKRMKLLAIRCRSLLGTFRASTINLARVVELNRPITVGWLATVLVLILFGRQYFGDHRMWREYARNTQQHSYIPDCSLAGYRFGEEEIPSVKTVCDVKAFGALGDGKTDDTEAFKRAIKFAAENGGGAIDIGPGTFVINEVLYIEADNTVLRGAGVDQTTLLFPRSLEVLKGRQTMWSFRGGMIWVRPKKSENPFEYTEVPSVWVSKEAAQGSKVIEIDATVAHEYQNAVGETVWMRWKGRKSLIEHIYGQELEDDSPYVIDWHQLRSGLLFWERPNEIVAVDGNRLTLKKPLRLDIRTDWQVMLGPPFLGRIANVGIEDLTVRSPEHKRRRHNQEAGFNGVFFENVIHSWVRNVRFTNLDSALVIERSSNNTFRNLHFTGMPCHHASSFRLYSHDNLMEHFRVDSQPHHGVGAQSMASGNVWRSGVMKNGTFDYHKGMPFDSIRTNIQISNSGRTGGPSSGGPFTGRRIVHWNIEVVDNRNGYASASSVYLPYRFSHGALVGVYGEGVDNTVVEKQMVKRRKRDPNAVDLRLIENGTQVSDMGKVVWPLDLYVAQKEMAK